MNYKNSNLKKHPNFAKKFMVFMAIVFFTDVILFAICFYTHSNGLEKTSDISIILVFMITFFGLIFGFFRLHNVKCPSCGQKTKTIKNKEADMWQAYCTNCKITWSLGIGIDTGP
jgi:arginine exporter protein ArgO